MSQQLYQIIFPNLPKKFIAMGKTPKEVCINAETQMRLYPIASLKAVRGDVKLMIRDHAIPDQETGEKIGKWIVSYLEGVVEEIGNDIIFKNMPDPS
jgi:hypothetical protein